MYSRIVKPLLLLAFSFATLFFSNTVLANEEHKGEEKIDPAKIIIEHVSDAHDFHFFNIGDKPVSIPLPVILYNSNNGLSCFMSSKFHHGHKVYNGYMLFTEHFCQRTSFRRC